jgi:hypothetical protein
VQRRMIRVTNKQAAALNRQYQLQLDPDKSRLVAHQRRLAIITNGTGPAHLQVTEEDQNSITCSVPGRTREFVIMKCDLPS